MAKWAQYSPIKSAVRDADTNQTFTYRQLNNLANYVAGKFVEMGLKKGDRVAALLEFCPEYIVLLGVAQKLGIILVPLNYRLSGRELAYMINNCQPALLITENKFSSLIEISMIESDFVSWNLTDFTQDLAERAEESYPFDSHDIAEDHPLFILYTSGTTGFPKGAIYSHKMVFWNAINTETRLDITANDHTIICTPPFHTGGWNVLLTPFLLHGGSFTLLRKFDPDRLMKLLDDEEVTLFMAVPTMLKMMAECSSFRKYDLEALRYFIVGGEAMPVPLIEQWQNKGIPIRQGYGLTEVGPNVASLHHDDSGRKIGSIGTFNFFVDTRLVKSDGTPAGIGEEGELWMRGPMVTPGYWQNEEATKSAIQDGWFRTGDVLIQDDEGYFFVKDRIKNMYISGGENVYPAEIEKYLLTHPEISEVVIVGVPDDRWGEVGHAIIVRQNPALTIGDVHAFCSVGLAKYKIPKHVTFEETIPQTASGKIDRNLLANRLKV